MPLCKRDSSALIIVDIQDSFLAPISNRAAIMQRAKFIIEIARILGVPMIATEQYASRMGATNEEIVAVMGGSRRFDKLCFSSCRSQQFWEEWKSLKRNQAVIIGIETHICVNQTVHDFAERGVLPFVCADAVSGRIPAAHEIALARMRDAGAVIAHTESIAYEWLGEAGSPEFKAALEIIKRYA
jgi:isochorismate hydrolase